ncbi:hypothetical protein [Mycobacteroides abscessus]
MSYKEALSTAIAGELNRRSHRDDPIVKPDDIVNIDVRWDDGDRYSPTYGEGSAAPTLEVLVTVKNAPQFPPNTPVSIETVFGALLRAVLETGL